MAITVTLHGPSSNALLPRITPEALAAVINTALASLETEIATGDSTEATARGSAITTAVAAEATARATSEAALVSTAMDPVATASTLPAARALFQKLDDGTTSATAFPLVGSASTGWYRHTSTADPVSGSTNTWCLVVDGTERYRFFDTVMSCNLPPGDNWGITDGSRVFHIGNDGTGYYVVTTTDHMLRVGTHGGAGPTITFGDEAGGGTGFTGRFSASQHPFCFGNADPSGATNGVVIDGPGSANTIVRITNAAGATARSPMGFYRSGGTLVGSITTTDTTTAYVTTSDERLKTIVGPVSNSGDLIDALAPFWHTWNGSPDTTHYLGMSAQAVAAHVPGVVVPGNDKEPGEAGFTPWQGDWSKLVPLLIAEVQALRARVATLEAAP